MTPPTKYTIERNGKPVGEYSNKWEALDAYDKFVGYAIAPDEVSLKKGNHVLAQYTPLPIRKEGITSEAY